MSLRITQARIPTMLGMGIVLVGLASGTVFVQAVQHIVTRAAPEKAPRTIRVTNVTDTSFTISWTTDVPTAGFIAYGTDPENLTNVAADDTGRTAFQSAAHHVTIENLAPGQTYAYAIQSDGQQFADQGRAFTIKTPPTMSAAAPPYGVLRGEVQDGEGDDIGAAVVYATIDDTTLSSQTNEAGRWTIPLTEKRAADGLSYLMYPPRASIELFVQAGERGTARATYPVTSVDDTEIPPITLGQIHVFAPARRQADVEPSAEPERGFGVLTTGETTITLQENTKIATPTPTFSGRGLPGEELTITVESDPLTTTIVVEEDGTWSWTVPTDLEPGTHTITIQTPSGGTITRTFTIGSEGESQVTSPSPSPSPTPTPTPIATPSATRSATPSAPPVGGGTGLPDTANAGPMVLLLSFGMLLIFGGLLSTGLLRRREQN